MKGAGMTSSTGADNSRLEQHGNSRRDAADMHKLGVRQETKRRFGLLPLIGLCTTLMVTWEAALVFFFTAFLNGGGPSMLYGYIFACLGAAATCASMAEMASMYPIAGAQYHWTALLAPPQHAKFLSWLTGWLSTLGWQAIAATGTYVTAILIETAIAFNYPSYAPNNWQTTLFIYALILLSVLVNTLLVKLLPGLEVVSLILHVIGFFGVMVPLLYYAPKSSNHFVWTDFTNLSGYSSDGVSWLIGQSVTAIILVGYDGACHMAEEVKDASENVPRAMMATITLNGILGFGSYLIILYCFGDVDDVLKAEGFPFIGIFFGATKSHAGTSVVAAFLLVMFMLGTFGFYASASRQAWAFARNNGLPLSKYFSRIRTPFLLPIWTITATAIISILLGLINIGSSVAFAAIISLVVSGFLSSYLIPIILMIRKRLRGDRIRFGPWNLGRYGLAINLFAVFYTVLTVIFTFFPPAIPVNKKTMNYSCVVYGGVIILGLIYYALSGHKNFVGPDIELDDTESDQGRFDPYKVDS